MDDVVTSAQPAQEPQVPERSRALVERTNLQIRQPLGYPGSDSRGERSTPLAQRALQRPDQRDGEQCVADAVIVRTTSNASGSPRAPASLPDRRSQLASRADRPHRDPGG